MADIVIAVPDYSKPIIVPLASGIKGDKGEQGVPGASGGGVFAQINHTAPTDGQLTLALVNALPGLAVFINGLMQTDFTYSTLLLTLPATLNIVAGDIITVTYYSNT